MAYSEEQWLKAKDYYEAGLSLSKIKDKTGIARNTVSQRAKKEQWEHSKNADYIEAKTIISQKKGTEKEHTIQVLDEIADERTKHLMYFQNSALKNQEKANKALETVEENTKGLNALETHSRITQRNKETVLGKDLTTKIDNTNAQQNNTDNSLKVTFE